MAVSERLMIVIWLNLPGQSPITNLYEPSYQQWLDHQISKSFQNIIISKIRQEFCHHYGMEHDLMSRIWGMNLTTVASWGQGGVSYWCQ